MTVPRHRIPKIKAICIKCGTDEVATLMSQDFADGYHRRHRCKHCDEKFYTLANYDGGAYQSQQLPFKDRALTLWEQKQRVQWAAEAEPVTTVVTPYATEFIETIQIAFDKQQNGLPITEDEQALIETINNLERAYYDK